MTRIRVAGTVDVAVALDLDKEVEAQQKQAANKGAETPTKKRRPPRRAEEGSYSTSQQPP